MTTIYKIDGFFFFFNDTATTEIYTLSLHDALPISISNITAAYFDTQETLNGYYHLFQQILKTFGIPYGFFTDHRTVFEFRKKGVNNLKDDACTQFGYACKQLSVQLDRKQRSSIQSPRRKDVSELTVKACQSNYDWQA